MTEPAPSPNSPLPWRIEKDEGIDWIVDANGTGIIYPEDVQAKNVALIIAAVNTHATLTAERDALRERAAEATIAREEWRTVAKRAGICMTCAQMAPEPYGCTDCLNTGWDGGAPVGFVAESARDAALAEVAGLRAELEYLSDNWSNGWAGETRIDTIKNVQRRCLAALAPKGAP